MLEVLASKQLPPNISLPLFFSPFPTCGGRAGDGEKEKSLEVLASKQLRPPNIFTPLILRPLPHLRGKGWGWGEVNSAEKTWV